MGETKNFDEDTALSEPSGTFVLGGRTWHVRNSDDVSVGFRNMFKKDGTVKLGEFFTATLLPDDLADFLKAIEDPAGAFTPNRLTPVVDYVTSLITRRPTTPTVDSSPGSKTTGRKSTAGSSSRGTRQRRSA